jgi:hypothetical protein
MLRLIIDVSVAQCANNDNVRSKCLQKIIDTVDLKVVMSSTLFNLWNQITAKPSQTSIEQLYLTKWRTTMYSRKKIISVKDEEIPQTVQKLNIQLNDPNIMLHLLNLALSHDKIILFSERYSHDCSMLSQDSSYNNDILWLSIPTDIIQELIKVGKL